MGARIDGQLAYSLERSMYVEGRIYTSRSGTPPVYLKINEEEGVANRTSRPPGMPAYYYTELGPLNMLAHVWG
jgi:hypothetical protein